MISSFKHKGLQKFYETGNATDIQPAHENRLKLLLVVLDTATCIEDLDIPGFELHQFKGNKKGIWSIKVNENWRTIFKFEQGNVYIVNYEDYH